MKKIIIIGTIASDLYIFRKDLILSCIKKKFQVYTFISEYDDQWLDKIKKLGAIPVIYQLSRGGLNPLSDIFATYQLTQKIKKIKPDIVFSYSAKPIIYGTFAARIANTPHVIGMLEGLGYTFTEQPDGISKRTQLIRNIQIFLYKLSLPKLDHLIFLNPDDRENIINQCKISVPKVNILGGIGLNLDEYKHTPAPIEHVSFLFIGRLLKEKGIFELIEAIKIVKQKYPETRFTIIGRLDTENLGSLKKEKLEELIEQNLFEYPGYVSNVMDWINKSSVFVLPSYREGLPRSTQEAMAIGRPVITTDVPGCRETVVDGVTGFLVPKWDVTALAEKMIYFIEHPEQIRTMGYEGYLYAKKHFDVEIVNQRFFQIIGIE